MKSTALSNTVTHNANLTSMRFNQMLGNGQANPAAPSQPGPRFIHTVETGKEMG